MSETFLPSAPKIKGKRVLEIFNKSNPESVFSLVDTPIQKAINKMEQVHKEMTREQIEDHIHISQTLNRLRLNFWDVLNSRIADQNGELVTIDDVIAKITTYENGREIFENPIKMAYILLPVHDYDSVVAESLEIGLAKLRRVLEGINPISLSKGFNVQQANVLLKIVEFLDKRVHGTAVQRIEAKTLQLTGDINATEEALTPAQIQEKIKNLESELSTQTNVVEIRK